MLLSASLSMQDTPPAASQAGMVEQLKSAGFIRHPRVESCMLAVDRCHFARLPRGSASSAAASSSEDSSSFDLSPYSHSAFPIGQCATISSPHSHAQALTILEPYLSADASHPIHVLDVGSGSGYMTACFAEMVGLGKDSDGKMTGNSQSVVVALDHSSVLLKQSYSNIALVPRLAHLISNDAEEPTTTHAHAPLRFVEGNAKQPDNEWLRKANKEERVAPFQYDVIHVGAAYATMPFHLVRLLRVGGVLLVPVSSTNTHALPSASASASTPSKAGIDQQLILVKRTGHGEQDYDVQTLQPCSFAPIQHEAPAVDIDSIDRVIREQMQLQQQLKGIAEQIKEWQTKFKTQHSRKPTSSEMVADASVAQLLRTYAPLNKRANALAKLTGMPNESTVKM